MIRITQLSMDLRRSEKIEVNMDSDINQGFKKELYDLLTKYNIAILGSNTYDMMEEYADIKSTESCHECGQENLVGINSEYSKCNGCGADIKPCNMCSNCYSKGICIFD